jgi:hypothetical protein
MSFSHYDPRITPTRAEALFVSALQRSDEPGARQVRQAITAALAAHGDRGCAALVAQAYGDHPEIAVARMRWARATVADAFGGSRPAPVLSGGNAMRQHARAA